MRTSAQLEDPLQSRVQETKNVNVYIQKKKHLQTVWKMSKSKIQSLQQKLLIDETLSPYCRDKKKKTHKKNHPASASNTELGAAGQIVLRNYWTIKILFGCKMCIATMLAAQCPLFPVSASLLPQPPFSSPLRGLLPFPPAGLAPFQMLSPYSGS